MYLKQVKSHIYIDFPFLLEMLVYARFQILLTLFKQSLISLKKYVNVKKTCLNKTEEGLMTSLSIS